MSITAAVKSSSKSAFKEPAYSTVHSVLSASPRTCSSCSRWQASHRVASLCGKMHPKQPESWHSRRSRESLALVPKGKTEAGEAGTSVKSFRSTTPTLYQQPIQLLYSVLHSGAKPAGVPRKVSPNPERYYIFISKVYTVKSDAGRKRGTKSTAKLNLTPLGQTSSCYVGYMHDFLVSGSPMGAPQHMGIPATIRFTMQGRHMSHDPGHRSASTLLPTQNR